MIDSVWTSLILLDKYIKVGWVKEPIIPWGMIMDRSVSQPHFSQLPLINAAVAVGVRKISTLTATFLTLWL
jgi:hypothetical protein